MDTAIHKRVLSILHIVGGSLTLVVFLLGHAFFRTLSPFIEEEILREEGADGAFIFALVSQSIVTILVVIAILIPIPSIIGGIAVLNEKKWGLVLLMVSGCLSLFSFPIGTAIGVYTIWVYIQENKKEANVETQQ